VAGSAAVGAAGGRPEQHGSNAACSNRRAWVAQRGEVAGVSLSECQHRGEAQNFAGAMAHRSRVARGERLGEKSPPPSMCGAGSERGGGCRVRLQTRVAVKLVTRVGFAAQPVKEKKDFRN
jgi:hypothetical protein